MKSIILFSLFAYALVVAPFFTAKDGNLKLKIFGLKPSQGFIMLALYNSEKGFTTDETIAFRKVKVATQNNSVQTVVLEHIPFGKYAIISYQDVNGNEKMDANFIGIPKEPYGASNNARNSFGPPSFKEALFEFTKNGQEISFQLQ